MLLGGLAASAALDLRGARGRGRRPGPARAADAGRARRSTAGDLPALLTAGAALALVGLAEGLSAARLFAARGGYRIDADQELRRLRRGQRRAAGCSAGIGVAGSLSKTAAVSDARGRTQVAGLAAAALALVVIVAIAPALSGLPTGRAQRDRGQRGLEADGLRGALRRYARVRRNDIVAAVVAAVGVLAFGPLYGLLLAVAGSVLGLVYRSSRVDVEVMGKVPHEKAAWGSIRDHEERPTFPGVLVLRVDAPIFWVTAAPVHDAVLAQVEVRAGHPRARARHGGDQPDGHDQRRRARRPAGGAAQARRRPLPRPRHVAGPQGAAPVRA